MYEFGQGVPQNFSEALRWFRKAEAAGNSQAAAAIEHVLQAQRGLHEQKASEFTQAPPPTISIGAPVELCGLQAKPGLNGRRGVVVKFIGASGRYRVQLDEGSGEFNLKAENLRLFGEAS